MFIENLKSKTCFPPFVPGSSISFTEVHCCVQPVQLAPWQLEERLQDAEPCHNYQGGGEGPDGCW